MPQVYVDSQKLRGFARELTDFTHVVEEQMTGLKASLGRLGETWRDQEFHAFVNQLASTQQHLTKFVEETKRTAPLLERDAGAIEELNRLKPPT